MSKSPVLSINDLTITLPKHADRAYAVEKLTLDINKDELLCVVGESGSGKSVMARAIMGLLPSPHLKVHAGEIVFRGENLLQLPLEQLRRYRGQDIAMIFQEPMTALNPLMTIGRQIDELLKIHIKFSDLLSARERRMRILSLMADVHLKDPERIYAAYPHQLSGGQRQRAMIVMALILEPDILIADEPTTALDVTTQAQILQLIRALQRKHQMAVLFITHDFGVVAEIADRVAIMQQGVLVEAGSAERILSKPCHPYSQSLIAAVPKLTPPIRPSREGAAVVLDVQMLTKSYPAHGSLFFRQKHAIARPAVNLAHIRLHAGEIVGLVGESGSGKSTLARCITKLIEADSGKIVLKGQDIAPLSRAKFRPYRPKIQMIFQDPYASLNPRQHVGEQIVQGRLAQGSSRKEAMHEAGELLAQVGLDPLAANRFPHEFSGGQRQRIGIARSLAVKPDILIADEPVSALDVSVQGQILKLLLDIRDKFGVAILFVTHDLRVAAQICDRIVVMHQGEIVETGATFTLFTDPQHAYTQDLLAAVPGRAWENAP